MARGGAWLREERKRRGFDHGTEFADALGIKQVRLSAYERGLYPVPKDVAKRIAKVFGMRELDVWRDLRLDLPADAFNIEAGFKAWTLAGVNVVPQLQYTRTHIDNLDAVQDGSSTFVSDSSPGRMMNHARSRRPSRSSSWAEAWAVSS